MSLTNCSSTVKFSSLTALTAAQNNFTAVEVHGYDLRDTVPSTVSNRVLSFETLEEFFEDLNRDFEKTI